MSKLQRNINVILIILFTAYAIYSVVFERASIFFIVYLFWFDEVIRNISYLIQINMHVEDIRLSPEFTKKQAISNVKARFFFLFVYSIFIVLVFGLFFHLDKEDKDALIQNVKIFMFHDFAFNICLMISIIREIFQIREARKNRYVPLKKFSAMSGHLLTLHISIILGGFMWALTSGKFQGFSLNFGAYNHYAIIFPFFIIKLLVDFYNINRSKTDKTLLDSLQKQ
jgi:hypothetical protein